jgi:hypothetical protein
LGGPSGTPPRAALEVAGRRGISVHRVLLAWLRDQSANIMPLVGASRPASIRDSAALLDLTDRDRAAATSSVCTKRSPAELSQRRRWPFLARRRSGGAAGTSGDRALPDIRYLTSQMDFSGRVLVL